MSVIDVLRPISTRFAGAGTAVPSGTLHGVSSDNSDSTYIRSPLSLANWSLRTGPHTPSAGYQRHRIRGRIRIRTDAGTAVEDIDLGRGSEAWIQYATVQVTAAFTEQSTGWFTDQGYGLATAGALTDLNIGGGWMNDPLGGATELRTAECYVDIDCRLAPAFSPQIQDNAGVDQSGGTVTDTNQPDLYFGTVGYDDLPALSWDVTVTSGATVVVSNSGSGVPPTTVPIITGLDDGAYTATFRVRSTIRDADAYEKSVALNFTIANEAATPSPPLLTVTPQDGGYLVEWTNPGGQPWDDDYVVAELWRDDCNGSQRIATVPDGLNGSYLDLAIPQLDPQPALPDCDPVALACDITYRVRYWGHISEFIVLPTQIPDDLILGWPGTVGTIPSGWTRVTSLDGWYPRGAPGTGAPTATGGAANHQHTGPSHTHGILPHSHLLGGDTVASNVSTETTRFNGASRATANQAHTHSRPAATTTAGNHTSDPTSPLTSVWPNSPRSLEVIWVKSDGLQTNYPVGILGWSAESVSGWEPHVPAAGRFLKGAPAAGNGGAISGGSVNHAHIVASHSHTGPNHSHNLSDTGLSEPSSSQEANSGGSTPRWLPRHTHPMEVNGNVFGTMGPDLGGTSESETGEPLHKRLRVLRNTAGGTQTRIIGLYTGTVAALDPLLTVCNGTSGTLDMRNLFARDAGTDSVNTTGGADAHTHEVTDTHKHTKLAHVHDTQVLTSKTTSYLRTTSGDLGDVPTSTHIHTSGNTAGGSPDNTQGGAGTTNPASNVPLYKEAHFVRLDGSISGDPLPVPELRVTDFASTTVASFTWNDGLDRLATTDMTMAVTTSRSSAFPKLVVDSTPLDGGWHTISGTVQGEDLSLVIAVEGKPAIDTLEQLLSADRVYWSPVGGTSGWFAPAGWSVDSPVENVKVVQVTMVRQPWPVVASPEEFI